MAEVVIRASDLTRSVTLNLRISGIRVARVRLWAVVQIMKLAAFVGGFNAAVETD